jgi:hypothetical protein
MYSQVPRRAIDVAQLERDSLFGLVRALEDASADGATKANAAGALGNLVVVKRCRAAVLALPVFTCKLLKMCTRARA